MRKKSAVYEPLCGLLHRFGNHLADTLVIENRWHSAARYENGDAVAKHESFWVIDLNASSADQFDRKGLKWRASLECA